MRRVFPSLQRYDFTQAMTLVNQAPKMTRRWRICSVWTALASHVTAIQDDVSLLTAVVTLKDAEIVAMKDEIVRLNGLPPGPKIKPKLLGMEQATSKSSGRRA